MHEVTGFLHYMFLPQGQPWYTGAFWSNQTQWFAVWIPSIIFLGYKQRQHNKRMEVGLDHIHKHLKIGKYKEKT